MSSIYLKATKCTNSSRFYSKITRQNSHLKVALLSCCLQGRKTASLVVKVKSSKKLILFYKLAKKYSRHHYHFKKQYFLFEHSAHITKHKQFICKQVNQKTAEKINVPTRGHFWHLVLVFQYIRIKDSYRAFFSK